MSDISASQPRTVSAFFDTQNDAQRAVDRLVEAGIPADSVRLVPGYESDTPVTDRSEQHRGFFASLADFFMPDEDRYTYAEGLSRGGYLVVVNDLELAHYERAVDILDDEGSIDLDEREQSWRSEGWSGYQAGATGYTDLDTADSFSDAQPMSEEISLRKEGTDRQETVNDTVRKTEVEIEDDRNIAESERISRR